MDRVVEWFVVTRSFTPARPLCPSCSQSPKPGECVEAQRVSRVVCDAGVAADDAAADAADADDDLAQTTHRTFSLPMLPSVTTTTSWVSRSHSTDSTPLVLLSTRSTAPEQPEHAMATLRVISWDGIARRS